MDLHYASYNEISIAGATAKAYGKKKKEIKNWWSSTLFGVP